MLTLASYFHDLSPFLWEFSPGIGLRWYGLSYALGFFIAYLLFAQIAKRKMTPIPADKLLDALLLLIAATIVGGRIGYVLIYDRSLLTSTSSSFPFWGVLQLTRGGMAYHGALVGVALAVCWVAKKHQVPGLHMADIAAFAATIGLGLGRLANFINGELLGKIVTAPGQPAPWWSVKFPQELISGHAPPLTPTQQQQLDALASSVALQGDTREDAIYRLVDLVHSGGPALSSRLKAGLEPLLAARHPSQLYQAFFEGIILTAVLWIIWRTPRRAGIVSAWFLITYGVLRVAAEFFRLPDAQFGASARLAGLSRGQWLSVAMIAAGVIVLFIARRRSSTLYAGWQVRTDSVR
jgi:phosphatidylglycerol---prolipoprotein diacylglyceryl transferase